MIYLQLYLSFFKIGILGFGGGMAILPMIYQSAMQFTGIDEATFANLFGISQATPGPMAVNAATFVGYHVAGVPGSIIATLGVATPSFILIALVVKFITLYKGNRYIDGAFLGIRPVTVGLIAAGFILVGKTAVFVTDTDFSSLSGALAGLDIKAAIMTAATFILASKFKVGSIKLIIIMAVLGIIFCSGILPV